MIQIIRPAFFVFSCLFLYKIALAHKPYNELQVNYANLKHYPEVINNHAPGVEVTIGDLHGNALKLLYFLIRNDVLIIPKSDYKQFIKMYNTNPDELSKKDISNFQMIINSASINKRHKIRILGDDLCDRGMNDFYSLYIYYKLDAASVPFDIILSNHNNYFLEAFERPEQSFDINPYGEGRNESTVRSMLNLGKLIEKGMVNKQMVIDLIQDHYLKHLTLPGYLLNKEKNEFTIYTHAPIDLAIVSALAKDLNIPFDESNSEMLTKNLEDINARVKQWILSKTFTAHYNALNDEHQKAGTLSPLKQILWNRDYSILNQEYQPKDKPYTINYVHGHDSMPNVFDLDNLFGKGPEHFKGPYAVHVTHS